MPRKNLLHVYCANRSDTQEIAIFYFNADFGASQNHQICNICTYGALNFNPQSFQRI